MYSYLPGVHWALMEPRRRRLNDSVSINEHFPQNDRTEKYSLLDELYNDDLTPLPFITAQANESRHDFNAFLTLCMSSD